MEETTRFNSTDDDPARIRDFYEFKKIMADIEPGKANVGSIMSAMVFQIGQMKEIRHENALRGKKATPMSELKMKKQATNNTSSRKSLQKYEQELEQLFEQDWESQIQALQIEHAIKETDFKHIFQEDKILKDKT